jgi:hypothetical protein
MIKHLEFELFFAGHLMPRDPQTFSAARKSGARENLTATAPSAHAITSTISGSARAPIQIGCSDRP